jgi:ParB-like chromosome segregation protein Spo0J
VRILFAVGGDWQKTLLPYKPTGILASAAYTFPEGHPAPGLDMFMLDSGAFSAWSIGEEVDLDKYIDNCHKAIEMYSNSCQVYCVNLDVIPGEKGRDSTEKERKQSMEDSLKNADRLRSSGIPVVEVFHQDEPEEYLKVLVERITPKDTGILGIAYRKDISVPRRLEWVKWVLKVITTEVGKENIPRCHGFGATLKEALFSFPYYCVDSTSWNSAGRWGKHLDERGRYNEPKYPSTRPEPVKNAGNMVNILKTAKMIDEATQLWKQRGIDWGEDHRALKESEADQAEEQNADESGATGSQVVVRAPISGGQGDLDGQAVPGGAQGPQEGDTPTAENQEEAPSHDLVVTYVPAGDIRPNPWNPNRLNKAQERALRQSIAHKGFVDPISVRRTPEGLEIVDGEQRWRILNSLRARYEEGELSLVAKERGFAENEISTSLRGVMEDGTVPVVDLGRLTDATAKQLTLIYNRTHGDHDPLGEARILQELSELIGKDEAIDGLPFSDRQLESALEVAAFDWENYLEDLEEEEDEGAGEGGNEEELEQITMTVTMTSAAYEGFVQLREHIATKIEVQSRKTKPSAAEVNGAVIERLCAAWRKS